jgi:thiamine-monophosphate kinase
MGDDAAVIEPARGALDVLTTDVLVEGVHFDRSCVPPAAIGHKALAVTLGGLAAMGAEPRAALLSLLLPPSMALADFDAMIDGWLSLASAHAVALVGGNISRSPGPLVLDVTVVGSVKPRRVLTRAGARPGDGVYVSGTVGAARAGRLSLERGAVSDEALADCRARFLRPQPRVRLGMLLGRNRVASACVDASDGLADAVGQLAAASGAGITIDADAVPVPPCVAAVLPAAPGTDDGFAAALAAGEDCELVFTVPARRSRSLKAVVRLAGGVPCTRIGTVTAARSLLLRRRGADAPLPGGSVHFR